MSCYVILKKFNYFAYQMDPYTNYEYQKDPDPQKKKKKSQVLIKLPVFLFRLPAE